MDIKKGKMKNQVYAFLLDLPFIELGILALLLLVLLPLIFSWPYLDVSALIIVVVCLGFIGFHRLIVRYYNYKLPQRDDFSLKDEKSLLHYLDYKEKSLGIGIKKEKGIELYNNMIVKKDEERLKQYKERIEKQQQMFKKMREERLQKYYETIDELLEMNVNEWKQYLEKTINGIKKTIESGLDYFEKKKSLQTHNIYHLSSLEVRLEDRKNLLDNLRKDNDFVFELRERVKKDLETSKQRQKERESISEMPSLRKTIMKNLIKMNVDQYIKFLKHDIRIRQELIERETVKQEKSPFLTDLEKGLNQSTIDLDNLEKDPSYIDTIRKRIENSLDG